MWKESYRIGVKSIDDQHMELFRVTGNLIRTLNKSETEHTKKECIEAITFLKNYAVEHFADEEKYQAKIKYKDIENHKKLHKKFVSSVLAHESKMQQLDFSVDSVKDFTGMLAAWLVYHVADQDQKFVGSHKTEESGGLKTVLEVFETCSCDVLRATTGLQNKEIKRILSPERGIKGELAFKQSFAGDIIGDIIVVVSKPLALQIFEIMTSLKIRVIDNMVASSASEIVGIINEKAVDMLASNGYNCSIVESYMESGVTMFDSENSLGLYSLIGNMGVHDESVHS